MLPNDIIDVSSFMDSYVDVDLMDECANDLAERFISSKPTKILTVATTGLVVAIRKFLRLSFFVSLLLSSPHVTYLFLNIIPIKQWRNIFKCPLSMLENSGL